tara:strand:+ start:57779 stop:58303 length:525 start_codon:yes stop_codon:yes gene_type:complete
VAISQKEENVAVKLRLVRMGKRKQPTYRVVAADSRSPRNGRFIEILGTYEPRQEPSVINIDNERALHWLRNGAKPTERVEKLLRIVGTWEQFTGEPLKPVVYAAKQNEAAADEETVVDAKEAEESDATEVAEIVNEEDEEQKEATAAGDDESAEVSADEKTSEDLTEEQEKTSE